MWPYGQPQVTQDNSERWGKKKEEGRKDGRNEAVKMEMRTVDKSNKIDSATTWAPQGDAKREGAKVMGLVSIQEEKLVNKV